MRPLIAISACAWAWVVGRCIAFGIHKRILCWRAHMTADTWYRLTPIRWQISHRVLPNIPLALALLKINALALEDDALHITGLVLLTSAQAFFPVFVAQIHSVYMLAAWAFVNAVGNALYALWHPYWAALPVAGAVCIHLWFFIMEAQLIRIPVRRKGPEEERQPRVLTV